MHNLSFPDRRCKRPTAGFSAADWCQLVEHARQIHTAQRCVYVTFDELPALHIPAELHALGACCVVCGRPAGCDDLVDLFIGTRP